MRSIQVTESDAGQRLDRFLQRMLPEAGKSFLYRMLRKKNITLNNKKADGNERLSAGDSLQLFFSEDTLRKFGALPEEPAEPAAPAAASEAAVFLRDKAGERAPCSHECTFDGQRTSKRHSREMDVSRRQGGTAGPAGDKADLRDSIICETESILVVNKPAGILSQKAKPDDISMVEMVRAYLAGKGELTEASARHYNPGVVNRLDRNTSGLLIAAKTLPAARELSALLQDRTLEKYYYALVRGSVTEPAETEAWLQKDGKTRQAVVREHGFPGGSCIRTAWRPVASGKGCTLLEVHLITGKTHQIRAHLSFIGHPLAGDVKYGDEAWNRELRGTAGLKRPFLHACRLQFPAKTEHLGNLPGRTLTAPLPEDLRRTLHVLGMDIPD